MSAANESMSVRHWLPILVVIVAIGMTLRIVYAAGFIPVDDAEYARAAARMLDGSFSYEDNIGPPVNPGRLGIVLPLMALFEMFGANEVSLAIYPLSISLMTMFLVYAFTSRVFGAYAGLLATVIWSVVPVDLEFASKVNPDTPVTAFVMLGIFLVYLARQRAAADNNGSFTRGLGAGLAFGVAWLCKASTVYLGPFCLVVLAFDLLRDPRRYVPVWAGVAAGSIFVFGSEMIFYAMSQGDALYRFYMIETNYSLYPEFFFNEGAKWGYEVGTPYWKAVAKRVLLEGPQAFLLSPEVLYLPSFGLIASAYALYMKDRRFRFVALLFFSLLFMFNFFSASLSNYQPLPLFIRYFHSLAFAATLLTGGLLGTLTYPLWTHVAVRERPEGLFWGGILASVVAVAGGWNTFRLIRDTTGNWAAAERSLASVIRPQDRIYTDPLSRSGLEFFWKYPSSMNIVNLGEMQFAEDVLCGSYVLINDSYIDWLESNYGMWYTLEPFVLPDAANNPPPHWKQTWTNGNARLYEIDCAAG